MYYLKVRFADGREHLEEWDTSKLVLYKSQEDLYDYMAFANLEGNLACDCIQARLLAKAEGLDDPDFPCGDSLPMSSLTAIAPDGTETILWESE